MQGILIVDKPAGWTSFDVIAKLRGILATRKLGHSGTLDPMATGVLPVFVGGASKAVDLQENHDKTYVATMRLGLRTDTGDITGTTLEQAETAVTLAQVEAALPHFVGPREQLPPMYSAVKVNGQPLYKAARKGIEVERKPRPVTFYTVRCLGQTGEQDFQLEVACSKGAYIRVLLEDIGAALGVPATMSALRRTQAGAYGLDCAHTLEEIQEAKAAGRLESLLLPVESVFMWLPVLQVSPGVQTHLENGCPTSHYRAADGRYRVQDREGNFLGLATVTEGVLNVEKLFIERG